MVDRSQAPRRIDDPQPCFVRMQLVRQGVYVAAKIERRLGILFAEVNGMPADVDLVWTSGDFIDEAEYDEMMRNPEPNPYRQVFISAAGLADAIREQDEADWWNTRPIR